MARHAAELEGKATLRVTTFHDEDELLELSPRNLHAPVSAEHDPNAENGEIARKSDRRGGADPG